MKQEEIIQKATEQTLKNENSKIEEFNNDLIELRNELQYYEKELLDLGFDPSNPKVIPTFIDDTKKAIYMSLLNNRTELIIKINTVKGDREHYFNSQEN